MVQSWVISTHLTPVLAMRWVARALYRAGRPWVTAVGVGEIVGCDLIVFTSGIFYSRAKPNGAGGLSVQAVIAGYLATRSCSQTW